MVETITGWLGFNARARCIKYREEEEDTGC
jgi:hypothetical protein